MPVINTADKKKKPFAGDGSEGLHRKAVYDEFDGKGLVSSSLTMFLLYSRDLTEKGQSLKKFVKYIKK